MPFRSLILISLLLLCGCGRGTESPAPTVATAPPGDEFASPPGVVKTAPPESTVDSIAPDVALPPPESASPLKILEDSFEISEQFDDGSLKRRWHVRLYVNFDRGRPWQQQSPGSWVEHGRYTEFYPGGQQQLVDGNFVEGRREGVWTYWHPNGQIAKEGGYRAAKLVGEWKVYREDGSLLRVENY